ncbi:MAG: glycoside hydrolase family 3 C-terminal domain-containing protein [Acidimicrobiales bacterium]
MPDLRALRAAMTLDEKTAMMSGADTWTLPGVDRLGVADVKCTDGPNGARGNGLLGSGLPALCVPCGSALGATWNVDLVERVGEVLGDEALSKGARMLLAPTINLHRTPTGGRNFECFSEDPVLTGELAAAYIRGVQSRGVATTPKHLVANDAEFERNTTDSVIDERTLREVYLLPFEMAVRRGGAWGVMSSYNRLNGTFCCENRWLVRDVLMGEWGFDGVVVSDWFAVRSLTASLEAGLHLEMPGPALHWGEGRLAAAVRAGEAAEADVDAAVDRLLRLRERVGALAGPLDTTERVEEVPERVAVARRAAAEATVLLVNDGILPLDVAALRRLAVVGPNASVARIMGGGSANINPLHRTSPLDALVARLGDDVEVVHARGCDNERFVPALDIAFDVDVFAGHEPAGEPVDSVRMANGRLVWSDPPGGLDADEWSVRASASFVPVDTGVHTVSLVQAGRARLWLDDRLVCDGWDTDLVAGDDLFGFAREPLTADVDLVEGVPVALTVEYANRDTQVVFGAKVGLGRPAGADPIAAAEAAAAGADAVIVVVGTNDEWETEGRDRTTTQLPGDQNELIRRVAAVNGRCIVVVNAGAPVAMDWVGDVAAVLDVWFGGQEMAEALVDVLVGDSDPGGRLPTTFPLRDEWTPAHLAYPGENSVTAYAERMFVGHRFSDARALPVLFAFGHGLSYTTFTTSATLSASSVEPGEGLTVRVVVTNTGKRRGHHVVQCYVAPSAPRLARPPTELKGFAKVDLAAGESREVTIDLGPRAFAHYDPGDRDFAALVEGLPVPAGRGHERSGPGWVVDPGRYDVLVAESAVVVHHVLPVDIAGSGPVVIEPVGL